MKNFLKMIYSYREPDIYTRVWTILGIKIKKIDKFKKLKDETNANLFNLYHNLQYNNILNNKDFTPQNIYERLREIKKTPRYLLSDKNSCYLDILLGCEPIEFKNIFDIDNAYIIWGIRPVENHKKTLIFAENTNKPVMICEDGFLRSADTAANKKAPLKFRKGISFTVDDLSSYFDATKITRMEQMLNDKSLIITEEQKARARKCIDRLLETHLTKYNHQPIFTPEIGRKGREKVLVVDQSYGDMSVLKGLADETTFKTMLETAIKENPDADIIVKTHPDTMTGKKGGYYTELKEHDNIYLQKTPINPISLIKYVDKVYVCSTQLGFEALMCGKEVHTFGMPFYAGWGLTVDAQTCNRRHNTRTLEEIFYIAYIMYSYYVNPNTNKVCEIEDAIDYLLKLREEYKTYKNKK